MSSSVQIDLLVASVALLLKGIDELGHARQDLKELQDCHGKTERVDFVFKNEVGDQIGVRQNKEGQVEFVAKDVEKPTVKRTLNQVRQAYARLKVLDEVKKKGYQQVKEEKLSDGSIRVVVQKWR